MSDMLALGVASLTPQQAADMALVEDQQARRARARGDRMAALQHEREADSLAQWSARLAAL